MPITAFLNMSQKEHIETELTRLESLEASLISQLQDAHVQITARRAELIELTCPYKVGQVLMTRKGEIQISRVLPRRYGKRADFEMYGRRKLKSGAFHKTEVRLYDWDMRP